MRICGFAAEGLRNERRIHETFPVKELQDYWSSRPKYEDVNPKSKEFRSGSLLSNKVGEGEEDPGGGGQTYQEWLALQREEREDVPPPPYTLEGVEESIPQQTVTNANIPTSAEVSVQNSSAVANVQPPVSSSSHTAARPAVNTNTYPASQAVSSSHAVVSPNLSAVSPPAVKLNTYPSSSTPVARQEAYPQISAQSPHPYLPPQGHSPGGVHHHPQSVPPSQGHSPQSYSPGVSQHPQLNRPSHSNSPQPTYPPAQGHSPGGVHHHPQSVPPSQGHSPKLYPPDVSQSPYPTSGQPVQSYPPRTGQQQHQPYQAQNFQSYPPASGQTPGWGQQPQSYSPGGSSYQGYPTSTGHTQGYPSTVAPSQEYTSPDAQPYPTPLEPVRQGYPPVDIQGHPSNYNTYQPPQDSVTALTNEFGRQSISNPTGVPSDGRLPPPPLHPSRRPSSASLNQSSPSGVSSGGNLPPPPLHPERPNRPPSSSFSLNQSSPNFPTRPQSQSGQHAATSSPPISSSLGRVTSTPTTTTNRPRWPPAEWESDTPPVAEQFSEYHRPSAHGHLGATLARPQTAGASSSNLTGGSAALRPTSSMSTRPPRPNTTMPSTAYLTEPTAHPDNNANPISFPTGPAKYEQYFSFPAGPLYNTSPSYPEQQGDTGYGSWPGSGHVSPQPPPTFPVSSMAYGGPGPSYGSGIESQYPGGPSTTGSGLNFPEAPGDSYFDASSSSSSYPAPWTSTNSCK